MRSPILILVLMMLAVLPARAGDAAVIVKLATLAPQGSTWERALAEMGAEWERISAGGVKVRIYAGGVAGNEGAMMRKIRIGQLQAASVTSIGLQSIDSAPQVLQTPLLIRNNGELDFVMRHIAPQLEQRIEANGFIVLNWSDIGWVHMFSARPMREPADTARFKTWVWSGDPAAATMFKAGGFRPVLLDSTDVLPGLQSGLVDAFPTAPLSALGLQWFALAPHMLDLPWAPLVGATVIDRRTWQQIPEQHRAEFRRVAQAIGARIQGSVRAQEVKAVEVMQQYGLSVTRLDAPQRDRWLALQDGIFAEVRQKIVPADLFDHVRDLLAEHRAGAR